SGNLTTVVTALSTNSNTYNSLGLLTSMVDPLGNFTTNLYDNIGNLTNVTVRDAGNNLLSKTSYTYDSDGNRQIQSVQRTPAIGSSNVTVYDAAGRVFQTIDARGTITGFKYDTAGRRVAVTNAVGTSLTNITQYAYDANGSQTNMVDNMNRTTSYFYDAINRRTNTTFPDNSTIITQFDAAGRRISETDQATNTTKFAY